MNHAQHDRDLANDLSVKLAHVYVAPLTDNPSVIVYSVTLKDFPANIVSLEQCQIQKNGIRVELYII